jgi:hypothetical protein
VTRVSKNQEVLHTLSSVPTKLSSKVLATAGDLLPLGVAFIEGVIISLVQRW